MGPRTVLICAAVASVLTMAAPAVPAAPANTGALLSSYVRPLVGTQGEGNTYPGPSAPFGMIQPGPDTEDWLWETASGYEYADSSIIGFSLTHFTGTGIPDLGDFLFQPVLGTPPLVAGTSAHPDSGYRASYSHADESASAGYYRVRLRRSGIQVELSASERTALMRFTFPASDSACIIADLRHVLHWDVIWSQLRIEDDSTITGMHLVSGWAKNRTLYFAARFSRPFEGAAIYKDGKLVQYDTYRFRSRAEAAGARLQFVARWRTHAQEAITLRACVSAVSTANALQDLESDRSGGDLETMRRATEQAWDRELGRIEVDAPEPDLRTFYTSLYHAMLAPTLYEDVNGEYRGLDQATHHAQGFHAYTTFSLWDTYRAEHPLLALIEAGRDADMVNSLLAHYDQSVEHLLPVWAFHANETWCMIGYHAVPVIVDAYFRGVTGFDPERAYRAIRTTALNPNYDNVAAYARLGWVPFDLENESVSKTLEYAYDDWCVARMAEALGHHEDAAMFRRRAGAWRNLFDRSSGLMRGRDLQGHWRTPFEPHRYLEKGDITEGTNWQYSWYVPHDVPGLIAIMGGAEPFARKLDSLFVASVADSGASDDDIRGRIGEYWHGNEPSHHIAYLYDWTGQPWKTQARVREILRTQYGDTPGALSGNDDCGQMSAWYLFSALGFYPVCPGGDEYAIGSPLVRHAALHLSNGRTFTVQVDDPSPANVYVQSAMLDGKPLTKPFLPCAAVAAGGTLTFQMGPKPNRAWGVTRP